MAIIIAFWCLFLLCLFLILFFSGDTRAYAHHHHLNLSFRCCRLYFFSRYFYIWSKCAEKIACVCFQTVKKRLSITFSHFDFRSVCMFCCCCCCWWCCFFVCMCFVCVCVCAIKSHALSQRWWYFGRSNNSIVYDRLETLFTSHIYAFPPIELPFRIFSAHTQMKSLSGEFATVLTIWPEWCIANGKQCH